MLHNNAFEPCVHCDGRGFVSRGMVPDRTFKACAVCKGCGQRYTEPEPVRPPNKVKPMPDPVVF